MIKLCYNVSFTTPRADGYDYFIIQIPEDKQRDKEYIKQELIKAVSRKYNSTEEYVEVNGFMKKDLSTIKLSEITIEEFALLFNLGGHLK